MNSFADQNFDICEHIEETTIEEENIDIEEDQAENILITDENLSTTSSATVGINETTASISENKIRLSKAERQALKEEKIAKRKAAKVAKQEQRKAEREAVIAARKDENKGARIAARKREEDEIEVYNKEPANIKEDKTEEIKKILKKYSART